MTAAFAELLVTDGEPHDYINLLDRMVEDSERIFEDIGPGARERGTLKTEYDWGFTSIRGEERREQVEEETTQFSFRFEIFDGSCYSRRQLSHVTLTESTERIEAQCIATNTISDEDSGSEWRESNSTLRTTDVEKLTANISKLESKIPEIVKDLTTRNDSVKLDLEKSLQASEFKVKGLDQLYKESSAENELLYEKFNGELGKIVKALKGKGKEDKEMLVGKLKEQGEDVARVRKENARLKRESRASTSEIKLESALGSCPKSHPPALHSTIR
ncbi:hypothetical protein M7I_3882 [Glarea lozoyensis 74030]|uniref:Uncharacterized protein n=1 Tax=Glarea lozoyensis (strain ATCC 74030 / MF5533) TaxID=1104152 RepID=H0EMP3_GLAL7|nr:hypothetical protein M7I_3882 [Glarea lozoyensis 74030]